MPVGVYPRPSLEERFWRRVLKQPDGCWLWTGGVSTVGYGVLSLKHTKQFLAHRLAFEFAYGPVAPGLFVCHRCDTPRCVRPEHLFLGTAADNNHDMARKGRAVRGERHHQAKLRDQDVLAIRARLANGRHSKRGLAREFGVSDRTIGRIADSETWHHLEVAHV